MFEPFTVSAVVQSILAIVAIVVAVAVWRWLRVALDNGSLAAQNQALAQIAAYASVFVAAAEQTMSKQPGFAKLDWVMAQFARVLPDMDPDLVRSYVEAAVKALPQPAPPPPANCDDLAPPAQSAVTSHSNTGGRAGKRAGT